MDKSRESQERGITLDLGFSSFSTDAPEHIQAAGYDAIQWCLVDCLVDPDGHRLGTCIQSTFQGSKQLPEVISGYILVCQGLITFEQEMIGARGRICL